MLPIHKDTHTFIVNYHEEHGITPTQTELSQEFDIEKGSVWNRLNRLEEAGLITRMPNVWRNIVII